MRDRHWRALQTELNISFDPSSPSFTLEKVVEFGFQKYADFIEELSGKANMELAIEKSLAEIASAWSRIDIDLVEYKEVYYKIRSTDDLFQTLEDHAVKYVQRLYHI